MIGLIQHIDSGAMAQGHGVYSLSHCYTTQTQNSSPDIRFSGNRGQAVPLGFTARYPEHLK